MILYSKKKTIKRRPLVILFMVYLVLIPIDTLLVIANDFSVCKLLSIIIVGIIIFDKLIKKSIHLYRDKLEVYFLLILVYWILSKSAAYSSLGFSSTFNILSNLIVFTVIAMNADFSKKELEILLKSFVYSNFFYALNIVMKTGMTISQVAGRITLAINGVSIDENNIAVFIAFAFIIQVSFFLKNRKTVVKTIVFILFSVVMVGAVFSTGSRGALLVLVISVFLLFMTSSLSPSKKIIGSCFILILIYIIIIFLKDIVPPNVLERFTISALLENGGANREYIWNAGLYAYKNSNTWIHMFGFGLGSFPYLMQQYYGEFAGAHNDYLQLLVETGAFGVFLFYLPFVKMMISLIQRKKYFLISLLTALLLSSFTIEMLIRKVYWTILLLVILIYRNQVEVKDHHNCEEENENSIHMS